MALSDVDDLIKYLDDPEKDGREIHKVVSNVLGGLHGIVDSDTFKPDADRAIDALRQHNHDGYAEILDTYAQNPTQESLATATRSLVEVASSGVVAPELKEVVDIDAVNAKIDALDLSEEMAGVVEQIRAVTPAIIGEKFDEALRNPDNVRAMEERDINVDDVIAEKPELVQSLSGDFQKMLADVPSMHEGAVVQAQEMIDKAIQDFPQMFDDALQAEIAESMERADQRIQKKFEDAAVETDEARNFLENGELPTNPDSELVQKYDQAVVSAVDTLMEMRSPEMSGMYDMMLEAYSAEYGDKVEQLLNQRIAEEAAAQGASDPAVINP